MSKRARIATYGSAVGLVLGGTVCAVVVSGVVGQVLTMALIGSGLVILTGLVFLEIGLSEDRDREDRDRSRLSPPSRRRLEPLRPPRLRGHRHER